MKKEELFKAILAQKEELLKAIKSSVATYDSGMDLDEEDTRDPEDFSHQTESGEMKHVSEDHRDMLQNEIDHIKGMDLSPKEHVAQGSLVVTENAEFLIGISFNHFENKPNLHGAGQDSPVYNAFLGKEVGESIEVN
ncbi:MAG: hypothetical protein MK078_08505 [Crocinitomicaceae bacterium]|nr:hypothetical protein [Crocinitomicaceae bacterium]